MRLFIAVILLIVVPMTLREFRSGDQLLVFLQRCSYSLNIGRVTAITDEKTTSGEPKGSEVFPMKPKPSTLAPKSDQPSVLIPIERKCQSKRTVDRLNPQPA